MAINFPTTPADGDTHTFLNIEYTYEAATDTWRREQAAYLASNVAQTLTRAKVFTATTLAADGVWNLDENQVTGYNLAVDGFVMPAPTNQRNGGIYVIKVINGGTNTMSWNAVYQFTGGAAPAITDNGTDVFTFLSDGTNMLEIGRSQGIA
jgi:hypothetical protein